MGPGARPGRRLDVTPRSRDTMRPSFANHSPQKREGAGKTGCALHPRSRVPMHMQKKRTRAYRFSGSSPAFPAQWFYALFRALPGDRLSCHRHSGRGLLPGSLTPAPRRQDHTTAPSASRAVRQKRIRVHRIPPRVRDDREPPLMWDGTAKSKPVIWVSCEEEIFLQKGLDTNCRRQSVGQITSDEGRGPCINQSHPHWSDPVFQRRRAD
jgi:hypothetical protein